MGLAEGTDGWGYERLGMQVEEAMPTAQRQWLLHGKVVLQRS